MNVVLAVLAANVAAVYFTIAAIVVPKIELINAGRRFELLFRGGAICFFVGCGLTHVHIALNAVSSPSSGAFHQVWMHVLQVVGGWLFIWSAVRFLLIRVDRKKPTVAELEDLASRDPLTGAFNRRHFSTALALALHGHRRSDRPVSVLMMDIDGFKRINDAGGHAAGDDVLRALVDVVGHAVRPADTFARLGGDEFGVVLPDTTRAQADGLAQRVNDAIAAATTPHPDHPLSVSMGLACHPEDALDADDLVAAADREMYAVKRSRASMADDSHSHAADSRSGGSIA